MSNLPKVSIVVPTKNSEQVLEACLVSIKEQTYKNIEIIVVDNDSEDLTKKTARRFTEHVFNKRPERSAQRNYGASKATGKFIAFIDSDMVLSPSVIADAVKVIQQDSQNVGVRIPEESFGVGFWARCKALERKFYTDISWMQAARLFYLDSFNSLGGYDTEMVSGEDWDLSQRIGETGGLVQIKSLIHHNEGALRLGTTLAKKYYYAQKFAVYTKKNRGSKSSVNQINPFKRYWLFFSRPKMLFGNPLLGAGMLFMKTAEFMAGAVGLLKAKLTDTSKARLPY